MGRNYFRSSVKLEHICRLIRVRIAVGEYAAGECIPAASSIAVQEGTSTATVRRAVKILVAEGWLLPVANNRPPRVNRFHPAIKQERLAPADPPCWPDGSEIGYAQHRYNDVDYECQRCGYHCNPCAAGGMRWYPSYGDEWEECGVIAAWCGRYAEGEGCLPLCDEHKQQLERDPKRMERDYDNVKGIVTFDPYNHLTSERSCWETFTHAKEHWEDWPPEPSVAADTEPDVICNLESAAIREERT
jgi:hypothetical protein